MIHQQLACAECGATLLNGYRCRDYFDALIAREFEHVFGAGAVHFHTVACYQLQHPQLFPLTAEATHWLWNDLGDVVERGVPIGVILQRTHWRTNGLRRVRVAEPLASQATPWEFTAADIFFAEPAQHAELVQE